MSIFASRSLKVVPIPWDDPHTVTIQKLPGRHLGKAQQEKQIAAQAFVTRMGGDAFRQQLAGLGDPADVADRVARAQADPLNSYDRGAVLQKGIKAWTYDEPVTPETIDDLSEDAADYLARAILDLTLPARDEAGRKNAAGSSTGS